MRPKKKYSKNIGLFSSVFQEPDMKKEVYDTYLSDLPCLQSLLYFFKYYL